MLIIRATMTHNIIAVHTDLNKVESNYDNTLSENTLSAFIFIEKEDELSSELVMRIEIMTFQSDYFGFSKIAVTTVPYQVSLPKRDFKREEYGGEDLVEFGLLILNMDAEAL